MENNLTTKMAYPSSTLLLAYKYTSWSIFFVSSLIFGLIIWVILAKTPKVMETYRWYLMTNFVVLFLIDLIFIIAQPMGIGPIPMVILG